MELNFPDNPCSPELIKRDDVCGVTVETVYVHDTESELNALEKIKGPDDPVVKELRSLLELLKKTCSLNRRDRFFDVPEHGPYYELRFIGGKFHMCYERCSSITEAMRRHEIGCQDVRANHEDGCGWEEAG